MARGSPPESSKSQSTAARQIWCRRETGPVLAFPTEDSRCGERPTARCCHTTIAAKYSYGALDGQHLEICWIKDQVDALLIQIQGSARVRLEDGTMLRINYAAHNGYPNAPIGRFLVERNIIPREAISLDRIREWMRVNPQSLPVLLD
jgi:membrane-bound lytic murein transglycosylase